MRIRTSGDQTAANTEIEFVSATESSRPSNSPRKLNPDFRE
ncbi:hypothetical protein RISK_002743 [Rhodopirellula islandica]|uniref:Uncharacterized protein n=1 Tax=Rhodopirellula islandica TaxID=595434 RepID=A0A0J1BFA9_RHOIS|nr:hypothetical protein RISK_002743 [Rhodopirellula islandica]